MAQSILIFDFGTNEEAAQQARHKVEAWSQGFRLGKKILLKFEREEPDEAADAAGAKDAARAADAKQSDGKEKSKAPKKAAKKTAEGRDAADRSSEPEQTEGLRVRVLIKLDFSNHEKLSSQRWLDRIPAEEPFKSVKAETIRQGNTAFAEVAKRFDLLD